MRQKKAKMIKKWAWQKWQQMPPADQNKWAGGSFWRPKTIWSKLLKKRVADYKPIKGGSDWQGKTFSFDGFSRFYRHLKRSHTRGLFMIEEKKGFDIR